MKKYYSLLMLTVLGAAAALINLVMKMKSDGAVDAGDVSLVFIACAVCLLVYHVFSTDKVYRTPSENKDELGNEEEHSDVEEK